MNEIVLYSTCTWYYPDVSLYIGYVAVQSLPVRQSITFAGNSRLQETTSESIGEVVKKKKVWLRATEQSISVLTPMTCHLYTKIDSKIK